MKKSITRARAVKIRRLFTRPIQAKPLILAPAPVPACVLELEALLDS